MQQFNVTDNSEAQPTYHSQSEYKMLALGNVTWYWVTICFLSRKRTLLLKQNKKI